MTNEICWSCGARIAADSRECTVCGAERQQNIIEPKTSPEVLAVKTTPRTIGTTVLIVVVLAACVFGIRSATQMGETKPPKPKPSQAADSLKSKLEETGELALAREEIRRDPANAGALLRLANMLYDTEQFDDAIVQYDRYLLLHPRDADARVDAAYCYYRSGDPEKAKEEIRTAIRYNPHHLQAYYNLGIICLNQGEFDEAREWLKKCVEVGSGSEISRKATLLMERIETMQ